MNTEQILTKLASSLNDEGVALLGELLQKNAASSAATAVTASRAHDDNMSKLAADLAANHSLEEIDAVFSKIAHEQKVASECDKIASDAVALGAYMGKAAAAVFIDELRAAGVLKSAEGMPPELAAAMEEKGEGEKKEEPESEEKKEEPEAGGKDKAEVKDEEKSEEGEKKEAVARRIAILHRMLSGV